MSDCEETDFFWESWIWTPGKGKSKKDPKEDKKCLKRKNDIVMKSDENIQKKKKKSKFNEAMDRRKEKKEVKKKKKKKLALEHGERFILTQGSSAKAKKKRKKRVAFDLSPGNICVKRPKCVSSSEQTPKKSTLLEGEAVRESESCSQVTVTGHSQAQTHANESQCTSEDINSQDLFITQKTFRTSPSEPSSGETSDKVVTTSPQMFTPRDKLYRSMPWIKQHRGGSYKCPQDLHFHQHHRNTNTHVQKPKTAQVLLTEEEVEEDCLKKSEQNSKRGKWPFQTQMELNANLTEEEKVSQPPSGVKAYPGEPIDVKPFLDFAKSKKHSHSSSQQSPSYLSDELSVPRPRFIESTSTQTENFFTTELSFYLNFCQKSRVTAHHEDLKPLDLSLPQRARKDLGMCLSVKTMSSLGEIKDDNLKEPILHPSCFSDMIDEEVKKEPYGLQPWSVSAHCKGERTLRSESESEPKSADMTTSSEVEAACRICKPDLTQVRAIQMRLNESFFFKTKGEGQSPRPETPLMKLAQQSREVKSRKGH